MEVREPTLSIEDHADGQRGLVCGNVRQVTPDRIVEMELAPLHEQLRRGDGEIDRRGADAIDRVWRGRSPGLAVGCAVGLPQHLASVVPHEHLSRKPRRLRRVERGTQIVPGHCRTGGHVF